MVGFCPSLFGLMGVSNVFLRGWESGEVNFSESTMVNHHEKSQHLGKFVLELFPIILSKSN